MEIDYFGPELRGYPVRHQHIRYSNLMAVEITVGGKAATHTSFTMAAMHAPEYTATGICLLPLLEGELPPDRLVQARLEPMIVISHRCTSSDRGAGWQFGWAVPHDGLFIRAAIDVQEMLDLLDGFEESQGTFGQLLCALAQIAAKDGDRASVFARFGKLLQGGTLFVAGMDGAVPSTMEA